MNIRDHIQYGANALSAPITPEKRVPMIDRSKVDPEIRAAAEGMEAMFLDYMLKIMRETVPENAMGLDSPATKIYTGMMDSEVAQRAAKSGGVGLADPIIAYLQSQRYTMEREQGVPQGSQTGSAVTAAKAADGTGGTDESRTIRK